MNTRRGHDRAVRAGGRPRARRTAGRALLLLGACLLPGCWTRPDEECTRQLQAAREEVVRQRDQLLAQKAALDKLTAQLDTVRGISPQDLERIFRPVKLQLASLTGGYDKDNRPGDDGVVVYLQPLDEEGDVLKVAGEIRIQLYDLAAPPAQNLVGEYVIPVDEARKLWYGKFMTNHYTVYCPWPPAGPPRHPEITIQATFVDFLTQRVLTAQQTCTVKLPPE